MCEKQKLRGQQDLHTSISLEGAFLASCQKSRGTLRLKKTIEKTQIKQHALLLAQVPASSVSGKPGGNYRQERYDAVSGRKAGKHRADSHESNRASKTGAR